MVSTCVTCSVHRPPLSPLSDEHRQLLHVIVSPVVNMTELTAYPLHICVTCKSSIEEVHKFQQTAQRGVKAFKSLILEEKPEPITIKTDPENDSSTIKQQFISVPESNNVNLMAQIADVKHFFPNFSTRWQELLRTRKNALSEEIDIKFEPECTPEADYGCNVSRHVERIPGLVPHADSWPIKVRSGPDPFKVRRTKSEGSGGCNGSSFTGMQNMINNVPYVQSHPVVQTNPKRISTQMQRTTTKGNPVKSIHVAKFAKNRQNLSSTKRNPIDSQQNVSSNWHVAENATKVDSNAGNLEVFTHEGRKSPAKEQGVRKAYKKIRKKPVDMKCTYCGKIFKGKESLKVHIKRIHLGLNCHFSCDTCEKSFRTDVGLKLHKQNKHEQPKETTIDDVNLERFCVECSVQFATRTQYKAHLTTLKHTPREQYAFVCETCEKRFPTHKRMQEHANAVHLNEKNFKCEICEKTYVRMSDVRKHVRTAHEKREKERPHVCHLCGNTFTAAKSLKDHLHAHQGLRPYECKLCPATFSYKAALFTHNRLKHLKMKTKKIKKGDDNDADVGKERKRKRIVKKRAEEVENEVEEIKGRKVEEEAGFGSEVENSEKIQIELELIGHDADYLSIDSYLNEMM